MCEAPPSQSPTPVHTSGSPSPPPTPNYIIYLDSPQMSVPLFKLKKYTLLVKNINKTNSGVLRVEWKAPANRFFTMNTPWSHRAFLTKIKMGPRPPGPSLFPLFPQSSPTGPGGQSTDLSLLASSCDKEGLGITVGLTGRFCSLYLGLVSLGHWPPPSFLL